MKTKLLLSILLLAFIGLQSALAAVPERKGWWKFDNASDLLKAEIGQPLVLTGTQQSVAGPVSENKAVQIGIGSFLTMNHGIDPNGGGTLVNEFTLQVDIAMPEASLWHAIYQTAADNSDDAELFINTENLIGAWRYGYSTNAIATETWYRVLISVKNGEFLKIYVNGELWVDGAAQEVDGRDALQSALILFGDNDGEDNPMKCAEAGIWDVALTAEQASELGNASSAPVSTFPAKVGWWKFDDAADMLKAEIGSPLQLTGTQQSVNGPASGNLATNIGIGSYLTMNHGIAANGGGTLVNEYSVQIDFSIPEGGLYHAMFQTAMDNSDDAELFTNTDNLIGAWRYGYSTDTVKVNQWYRMVVSVKNGEYYKIYMNGHLWVDGIGQDIDSRDALQSALLVFADNDGEDNPVICSDLGIWNVALTADQVALLGDATVISSGLNENRLADNAKLLEQNYPNPCNTATQFTYHVLHSDNVQFIVYDMKGSQVQSVSEGKKTPGEYVLNLDTNSLPEGLYTVVMITDGMRSTKRMVVVH